MSFATLKLEALAASGIYLFDSVEPWRSVSST
jgi:hypothetical protein